MRVLLDLHLSNFFLVTVSDILNFIVYLFTAST